MRFYPDLTSFETRLAKFDTDLVTEFRSHLLATQQYERRQAIADKLEQDYLEGFFGDHPDIVNFARELLLAGKREGARELNQMLKVVGGSVPASEIIKRLQVQYFPHKTTQQTAFTQRPEEPEKPKTEWEKIQEQANNEIFDNKIEYRDYKRSMDILINNKNEEDLLKSDLKFYAFVAIFGLFLSLFFYVKYG